jgi:threonine dehydrogenase-like Zn-dependent dehydrogenase
MKSVPRYLTVRTIGRRFRRIATGRASMLRYVQTPAPDLPSPQWLRLRPRLSGICGSDLATIAAKGSTYFSPLVSTPFVPGHEVVADVVEIGNDVKDVSVGDRVVLEGALHCEVREIETPCRPCDRGQRAACENVTLGVIGPGIQTGYCRDTGGGWSECFVGHEAQFLPVPDELSDTAAVLVEPLACAIHAVLKAQICPDATVLVLGCGTMGLLVVAAIRGLGSSCRVAASAKYPHQADLAQKLGADVIVPVGGPLCESVSDWTNAQVHQPELGKPVVIGGVDVTFDCVGASSTIDDSIRLTGAGGKVVLVGMPAIPKGVDWTAIWHQEIQVHGAYGYGIETIDGSRQRTFSIALDMIRRSPQTYEPLVDARYPLHEYRQAVQHALHAGPLGSVKTVFDFVTSSPGPTA